MTASVFRYGAVVIGWIRAYVASGGGGDDISGRRRGPGDNPDCWTHDGAGMCQLTSLHACSYRNGGFQISNGQECKTRLPYYCQLSPTEPRTMSSSRREEADRNLFRSRSRLGLSRLAAPFAADADSPNTTSSAGGQSQKANKFDSLITRPLLLLCHCDNGSSL